MVLQWVPMPASCRRAVGFWANFTCHFLYACRCPAACQIFSSPYAFYSRSYVSISQGVKPASYNKVTDPEIKEIIGECICQKKEER